jgi:hypothetical protein
MGSLFRVLTGAEEHEFREWARETHKPGSIVNPLWHPVVRDECFKIDSEWALECAEQLFRYEQTLPMGMQVAEQVHSDVNGGDA